MLYGTELFALQYDTLETTDVDTTLTQRNVENNLQGQS